ncbi:hypothetical protein G4Z16_17945 [Streptomyces bathyalis]|uniref:DUF3137 domain-containing protein n=1 Tax=Streptomyces bathyalis TaxID=2710756 RepID=A0A7T1WSX1_9ACTN|nr:hypothetical protein [Streptomyces bathyalis]QPP07974.1 hypothetical protein G4Z16_17945 [Streptomyces bathyalis]
MEALLYVLFFVALGALITWSKKRSARRVQETAAGRAELRSLAEGRGWTYQPGVPGLIDEFSGAGPLPVAKGVAGGNVVTGTHRGFAFRAFEYQSTLSIGSGVDNHSRQQIHYFPVWALKLTAPVPDIRILHRRWHSKLTSGTPLTTGIPQVDEQFHIVAEDEERARALLHSGLAQFLTSDPRAGEWPLEVRYGHLLTWRREEKLSTENLDVMLDFLTDAVGRLPAQTS